MSEFQQIGDVLQDREELEKFLNARAKSLGVERRPIDWTSTKGIPPRYVAAELGDFGHADFAAGVAPDFAAPRDVLVVGLNGRGKTHLAAAVAKLWGARWCQATRFLSEIRSTFSNDSSERETSILDRYGDPRCLVIDDVTAGNDSSFAKSALLSLLDTRIGYLRPTLVTCYQSAEQVAEFDPSIASRIGGFEIWRLVGPDRRKVAESGRLERARSGTREPGEEG